MPDTRNDQERLIEVTTDELLLTFVKIELEKEGLKSEAGRARQAVKACGDRQQGVVDELVRREVDLHNLPLPIGLALDATGKIISDDDDDEESD
jgi:hypothetical protein